MATFFFRAVAADGKVRSGRLTGDTEKAVVGELRRQGLTPLYVGATPKGSSFEFKLPTFVLGRRRDVSSAPRSFPPCSAPECRSTAPSPSPPSSPTAPPSASSCWTCSACSRADRKS